jgi:hypothetical protein
MMLTPTRIVFLFLDAVFLAGIVFVFAAPFAFHSLVTPVDTDLHWRSASGSWIAAPSLPYRHTQLKGQSELRFRFNAPISLNQYYKVKVDECMHSFLIDEKSVPLPSIPFCPRGKEVPFDLSGFLTRGPHEILIKLESETEPTVFDMELRSLEQPGAQFFAAVLIAAYLGYGTIRLCVRNRLLALHNA